MTDGDENNTTQVIVGKENIAAHLDGAGEEENQFQCM
jgi:hypothetical protein